MIRAGRLLLSVLLLTAGGVARAQDPAPGGAATLSIEDALALAVGESQAVAIAGAGVDRAVGQRWSAVSGALPQLSLTATYTRTFATEFDRLFAAPPTTSPTVPTGTETTVPTPTTGTGTGEEPDPSGGSVGGSPFSNLPFGQPNSYRVSFTVSQAIFGGGRLGAGLAIAGIGRESAQLSLDSAKASAALDTARAYYDAALADRLLQIAKETLAQATRTANETRLAFEVQRMPEFELLRAEVARQNQEVAVIRQERAREAAFVRLAQILDMPAGTQFTLTTPIDLDEPATVAPAAIDAAGVDPTGERVAVRQAEQRVEIAKRTVSIVRSQWFPTLAATASGGWTSYPDSVIFTLDPDDWYPNLSAGLNLAVPIFSGGRIHGEVLAAKADLLQAQIQAEQVAEGAEADERDAAAELRAAEAQWAATAGAVDQARRAYGIAEIRFREGVSTQTELAQSQLLMETALANRAQAARDLQVARIRTALLPLLPPGGAAPVAPVASAPAR